MTEGIEAVTTAALSLALDAASLRQQAIAANIANAKTEGYVPVQVSFEDQLDDARRTLQSEGQLDATSLAGVTPRLQAVPDARSGVTGQVLLDAEVARMAQNAVQYQALVKGLSKHYAILELAASDGNK
ncbi:flagellar basal body rod protein FlgB [Trinickia fusca]|uniref:Flagellar basal body rod protein FlgB n=1 Tax=Trinickia fusca TaxID=2419777 RepID=A0A494XLI6_9BURK|nr:flagellar basal body rod protein FlgB [Trinickia fusca]RKP48413.1 flagellar basal body rod protein FlgB [Trinickia fusca]